jgi:hypothetical protein
MHVYLFTGIVVALALTELTGFSPGGIVVAGYLAMFLDAASVDCGHSGGSFNHLRYYRAD